MAMTPQEIDAIAEAMWAKLIKNSFGDTVRADQVITGTEARVADLQQKVAALTTGAVDLDALADRVIARLAARLTA